MTKYTKVKIGQRTYLVPSHHADHTLHSFAAKVNKAESGDDIDFSEEELAAYEWVALHPNTMEI